MKQKFSTSWVASRQPRKQRKYRANAPLHIRNKLMSVNLSKALREKYGKRNFLIKKGDKIKIITGEFKKKTGEVEVVNKAKLKISVGGINRMKGDGSKVNIWFDPSNLQIQELNLEDKKRVKSLQRKSGEKKTETKSESKEEKNDTPKKK